MNSARRRGFTLIEVLIFIVVVSVGLAGILSVMNTVVKSSADPMVRKQSIAIAESLLEEILLKAYAKPAGSTVVPAGANRAQYDCVDDYNGYSHTGIVDLEGQTIFGLESYSISPSVSVTTATISGVSLKRVTVNVTGPGGAFSLSGYRGPP